AVAVSDHETLLGHERQEAARVVHEHRLNGFVGDADLLELGPAKRDSLRVTRAAFGFGLAADGEVGRHHYLVCVTGIDEHLDHLRLWLTNATVESHARSSPTNGLMKLGLGIEAVAQVADDDPVWLHAQPGQDVELFDGMIETGVVR